MPVPSLSIVRPTWRAAVVAGASRPPVIQEDLA
jgi:hypothetical protein